MFCFSFDAFKIFLLFFSFWKFNYSVFSGKDGKEPACNAGDPGSMPGLGRFLEKGMGTHSSILAWRIPWTEEPGVDYSPWGCKET